LHESVEVVIRNQRRKKPMTFVSRSIRARAVLTLLVLVCAPVLLLGADHGDAPKTVLITGANRGLGLEFARQYSEAGWSVVGTARSPEKAVELRGLEVRVLQLDVTDPASVAGLAAELQNQPIDLLINNAGYANKGAKGFEDLSFEGVERVIAVNTIGPMRVTQALLPNLRLGKAKKIVHITSGLGSIGENVSGGYYGYRESKAALNMFNRSLAADYREEGFICVVMSPGWVRTDMGGPEAPLSPEDSIRGMRKVIDGLTIEDSGTFQSWDGRQRAW
jgi:NAD(P)-dependent dehydrogenase (short-subunit alcohol dehydrogenase family)